MFHKTASKSSGEIKNVEIALQYFESRNQSWHLVSSLGYNLHIRSINSEPTSGAVQMGGFMWSHLRREGQQLLLPPPLRQGREHAALPGEQASEMEENGNLQEQESSSFHVIQGKGCILSTAHRRICSPWLARVLQVQHHEKELNMQRGTRRTGEKEGQKQPL